MLALEAVVDPGFVKSVESTKQMNGINIMANGDVLQN